ncbi:S-layer homology domain-containing protein [Acidaminobacter sp. JC074]|uniref:S-layer homology domain-containing protein n=1 Tax=Acidaminobacter sp. JC074 TaxID=2530199 RepID=UPI001F10FC3C|nr:S-layer homology domain-containing protein [Acidaminobacter sp. JC074]MCH4886968.1 S-layer homology domain-containing protein [Acidaminobacter sp. JC074]
MKKLLLIMMVLLILVKPVFAGTKFKDVDAGMWYSKWIETIDELKITSGYPDGTFRPDNQLKRIELLSFTMKSLGHDIQIADGYWGQNIIDKAVEENIIDSESLMVSEPDGYITRQETASVIYNAYLKEEALYNSDQKQQILDIVSDIGHVNDEHLQGVVGVIASGIVEGYDDGSFKPTNNLTRAEAAVFISRLALPEKRKQITLEMGVFEYKTTSVTAESFKVYYLPEHQDIYNMLTLIDAIENEDVENGYALIMEENFESFHGVNLYDNMFDFDYAPFTQTHLYKRWGLIFRKAPPHATYTDWIEVHGWDDPNQWEHEKVLKALFAYMFEDDSELVWNKFVELSLQGSSGDVEYIGVHNGRDVRIDTNDGSITLYSTRKTDILLVNALLYK